MACDITKGRLEPCKDSVGGIKAVYFFNYAADIVTETELDQVIDINDGGSSATAYKWEVKGASDLTQNVNSSRDTGTTYWEQVLNLTFKKLDPVTQKEIKMISYGRPQVVVEDYNGNAFLCGKEHGMDVTGGTIVTGGAMGDLSGYTLVMTGMERMPANHLQGAVTDNPFAGMATAVNVVTGSQSATYVLGAGGACASGSAVGTYTNGTPLTSANYLQVDVTVSAIGSWNIDTDTQNGYRFAGKGTFATTGTLTVTLSGQGTPSAAQTDSFTLSSNDLGGSGTCTQDVVVS